MLRQVPERFSLQLFIIFSIILLASIFSAFALEEYLVLLAPVLAIFVYIAIVDFRKIYLLLIFTIPLSVEFYFSGGFGTDLPTEPLMIVLAAIFLIYILVFPDALPRQFFIHSIILLLGLHLLWTAFLILHSVEPVVSLKFFLAKSWYVLAFVFMTALLIKDKKDFVPVFWALIIPLVIVTVITVIRHYTFNFSFEDVNKTLTPYFRNHVNYAALLSLAIPLVWFARFWYDKKSFKRIFLNVALLILLTGVFFAYTRGAWLALMVAVAGYILIQLRLMKFVIIIALAGAIAFIAYMSHDKTYLNYAPDFETTIYHAELGDHLEATFGLQDVSSAERVYRWVAAFHMFDEKPIFGVGPGNFYPYYKEHTVLSFQTYISDNEEQSTVHNYFLLMLVEQGIIGFLIFAGMIAWILIKAETIYHYTIGKMNRQYIMALILSFLAFLVQTMLSDLVEADKTGSIFFIIIALLINQDLINREVYQQRKDLPEPAA